ncbi:MAG: hypothetical protein ABI473_03955 [Candidatus Dormibacter sp.]
MPNSDPAKAQKRLRKVEEAQTRLAELAKRINAQAATIADLMAQANSITGNGPRKSATTTTRKAATATRKAATATRKPASTRRKAPAARGSRP